MLAMSKKSLIITLGILIALLPALGFPGSVEAAISVVSGIVIAGAMYFS